MSSIRYVMLMLFIPFCSHRTFICTITPLKKFHVTVRYSGPCELGLMMKSPIWESFIISMAGTALMFLNLGWDILLKSALMLLGIYFSYFTYMTGLSYFLRSNLSFSRSIKGWISLTMAGKHVAMQSCLDPSCLSLSLCGKSSAISIFNNYCSYVGCWSRNDFSSKGNPMMTALIVVPFSYIF